MKSARKIFNALPGGGLVLLLIFTLVCQAGAQTWEQLFPTGGPPDARERHTAVYDPGNNRMIVFGGRDTVGGSFNDVWVLKNANGLGGTPEWEQLSPTGGPSRILHSAVYDPNSNRMVVFAGREVTNNDVWVLKNANGLGGAPSWEQLGPTGGPPDARYRHTAVYDPNNNLMVVFGGAPGPYKNDVWVLEDANGLGTPNWTQLFPTGGPPTGRSAHTAVYDLNGNRMVVFGGWPGIVFGDLFNDVWVLQNANGQDPTPNWTQLFPTGGPPSVRYGHAAVYDPNGNQMVVFGGDDRDGNPDLGPFNDVWVLEDANGLGTPNWTQLSPSGGPPSARVYHSAVYDPDSNRMVVFGGLDVSGRLNDVWVLDLTPPEPERIPALTPLGTIAMTLLITLYGVRRLRRTSA